MSLAAAGPSQGNPSIPTLAEPSESDSGTGNATPRAAADGEEKKKKRSLFGFGKKKTEGPPTKPPAKSAPASQSPPLTSRRQTASPIQTEHPHFLPSSPGRGAPFASSPRLSSPAGSQIFERDVQESALLPSSPAIPSHIQTENYIPPVLDASSEAITDDHLDPDNVEIITHTSHQPASVAVTGGIMGHHSPYEPSWADELAAFSAQRSTTTTTAATAATANNTTAAANADTASNYGSFDTTDVRRLSFISFADVVQAEQQQFPAAVAASPRESMHLAGLTSLVGGSNIMNNNHLRNRSPSPIRSPVGSSSSPPTSSKSGSVKGLDMSSSSPASRSGGGGGGGKPLGSPTSMMSMQLGGGLLPGGPTVTGEIAIETMSQALRRTGSGDLGGGGGGGGVRSFPTSPI